MIQGDDEELVRVEFEYHPAVIGNHPVHGGAVALRPSHFWVVREYQVAGVWPDGTGTISAKYEYSETDDQFPIIKRIVKHQQAMRSEGEDVDHEYVYEYALNRAAEISPGEFTLSAFGLPEPLTQQ